MILLANSSIITELKTKIITEIINDETLFYAINSPTVTQFENAAELVNTHLFRFNQDPIVLDKAITFLTFQVHMPKTYGFNRWVKPHLEIWIISHVSCMKVDNIPQIIANRNDYISELLDVKFNGRTSLGLSGDPNQLKLFGELSLVNNTEGSITKDYLYRQMVFETKDLNQSICYLEDRYDSKQ